MTRTSLSHCLVNTERIFFFVVSVILDLKSFLFLNVSIELSRFLKFNLFFSFGCFHCSSKHSFGAYQFTLHDAVVDVQFLRDA